MEGVESNHSCRDLPRPPLFSLFSPNSHPLPSPSPSSLLRVSTNLSRGPIHRLWQIIQVQHPLLASSLSGRFDFSLHTVPQAQIHHILRVFWIWCVFFFFFLNHICSLQEVSLPHAPCHGDPGFLCSAWTPAASPSDNHASKRVLRVPASRSYSRVA